MFTNMVSCATTKETLPPLGFAASLGEEPLPLREGSN